MTPFLFDVGIIAITAVADSCAVCIMWWMR
jgi:hypothetical protein